MVLGAVGDTPYRIVLLLHILSALIAFAPVFTHPRLVSQTKTLGEDGHRSIVGHMMRNGRRIHGPALIVTGLLGFILQILSQGAWSFRQFWLVAAITVWVAMNGVLHTQTLPGERLLAAGDPSGEAGVERGGKILSLLLLVMLFLMIFKPGL